MRYVGLFEYSQIGTVAPYLGKAAGEVVVPEGTQLVASGPLCGLSTTYFLPRPPLYSGCRGYLRWHFCVWLTSPMPLLPRNAVRLSKSVPAEPRGEGYWPNFDNGGDFMSFDAHIPTRLKSLLHLYSSLWDAHQVLNPPFSSHVKKTANNFPRGQCPTSPAGTMPLTQNFKRKTLPYPPPPFVKAEQKQPPCHWQKGHTRSFFCLFFWGRGNPHTHGIFSLGLGLPPSNRTQ